MIQLEFVYVDLKVKLASFYNIGVAKEKEHGMR